MYSQIDSNKRKTWILIAVFVTLISLIGYFIGYITDSGGEVLILAALLSATMSLFGYFAGDRLALITVGARAIKREENHYLCRLVENLCLTAGQPTPKIYVIDDLAINALATGRDPRHASIAVTAGALEKLTNEELEGVIAHEISHIKNYDIRLMTLVVVLVGIVSIVANGFLRGNFGRKNDQGKTGGLLAALGLFLIILSPLIAEIIKLAVSRKREYLADASAALLTRYPEGLARALEKIKRENLNMKKAGTATAHLFIASPFNIGQTFMNLFSTHPPVEERIKQLRQMI